MSSQNIPNSPSSFSGCLVRWCLPLAGCEAPWEAASIPWVQARHGLMPLTPSRVADQWDRAGS